MKTNFNFLGLPTTSLNLLSGGLFVFLVCLGVRTLSAPEIALRVANAQLVASSSADRLKELATELDRQAELIKQKDLAYQQLTEVYQQSLKGKEGYGKLQSAIEVVETLPPVGNIEKIQTKISTTEELLKEITTEEGGI